MMNKDENNDLSLISWNILAPCWVNKEWYPTLYHLAADYQARINKIVSHISSLNCHVIMIQEAQEDTIHLFKEKLGGNYLYAFSPNNPTAASIPNGLLTLIHQDWKYFTEVKIINGILDCERGEAIQIVHIPSKNISLVNLHLDFTHSVAQSKMVHDKFYQLLGDYSKSPSIIVGDFNADYKIYNQFQWDEYKNVFQDEKIIPTCYFDPFWNRTNSSIDYICYDSKKVQLIQCGKGWNDTDRSLEDALKKFGSDHLIIWAIFYFPQINL
ncbi:unnamed protein product [Rotaria socialis]|uniref:Endonuclease/exonuclease/phosphatase domain-containing protein n=1 Tax=Rotaria socialis TaxID=392032 RepID=A0A821V3D4_9BILA|nr:unnamed protein product [Rotaria socialis]CAF3419598.1 unnamed protein product [Rotaria socialis]CAF3484540.1 unnamed protein product [Rotaria socialis]CAF3531547.1 unnamed protein product [Rotaria socialis]CAF4483899.1 unnamed protein product [Rotaria socialis]